MESLAHGGRHRIDHALNLRAFHFDGTVGA